MGWSIGAALGTPLVLSFAAVVSTHSPLEACKVDDGAANFLLTCLCAVFSSYSRGDLAVVLPVSTSTSVSLVVLASVVGTMNSSCCVCRAPTPRMLVLSYYTLAMRTR